MKYLLSLLLILFCSLSTIAADCPTDKPLKGTDGVCYSCDEIKPISTYYKTSDGEENAFDDYVEGKYCKQICPNRFAIPFGWLDMQSEMCYLDTLWGHIRNFYIYNPVFYINILLFLFLLEKIISMFFKKAGIKLSLSINVLKWVICAISSPILSIGILEVSRRDFPFFLFPYILSFLFLIYGISELSRKKNIMKIIARLLAIIFFIILVYILFIIVLS